MSGEEQGNQTEGQVGRGGVMERTDFHWKPSTLFWFIFSQTECHSCWRRRSGAPLLQWTCHGVMLSWAACTHSMDAREANDSNNPGTESPIMPGGWASLSRPGVSSPRAALLAGHTPVFSGTALGECFCHCASIWSTLMSYLYMADLCHVA